MARTNQLMAGRSLAEQVVETIGADVLYPNLSGRSGDHDSIRRAAAARLLDHLSVEPAGRSSIISLGFTHEDPVMAAKVANLLGELYVERYLRVEKNPRADAFFEEQLATRKQKLAESEQALETFRRQHGISVSSRSERESASAELGTARSALADVRGRQAELQSQVEALSQKLNNDARVPRSYYQLKERLATLETEESELALSVTSQHPRLREVREQIRGLQEKLKLTDAAPSYGTAAEQEQFNVNLQLELSRSRAELESARARQSTLSARVDAAQRRFASLENLDSQFNQLQAQVQAAEDAYRLYFMKVEDLRMVNARDAEKLVGVRVIESAQPPSTPLDSRSRLKILLGVLGGALAGIGTAFVLQFVRGRLETGEDVERVLGLPVLVSIAELDSR
jgi:uncharacterized protein involved in exopolysaccharide biosynthesis